MKMQKSKSRFLDQPQAALFFSCLLALGALPISSQAQAQTQAAQSVVLAPSGNAGGDPSKLKKIWTEDDLATLRRPWDILVDQQDLARQLAADAAERGEDPSATQPAKLPSKLSDGSALPSTPSDIQQKIDIVQKEILQLNTDLDSTKQAYLDATQSERRAKLKANIELLQEEIKENGDDLAVLQDRLQSVKGEQSGQSSNPKQDADVPRPSSEPAPRL